MPHAKQICVPSFIKTDQDRLSLPGSPGLPPFQSHYLSEKPHFGKTQDGCQTRDGTLRLRVFPVLNSALSERTALVILLPTVPIGFNCFYLLCHV